MCFETVFSSCGPQRFVPPTVEALVRRDSQLIGRLHYKEGHDLYHWRPGWFMLAGSALHFSAGERQGEEEVLRLKRLQELSKNLSACRVLPLESVVCLINGGYRRQLDNLFWPLQQTY